MDSETEIDPQPVYAVAIAASSEIPGLGEALEGAMSEAVLACLEEGIVDPDTTRERMTEARLAVLGRFGTSESPAPKAKKPWWKLGL